MKEKQSLQNQIPNIFISFLNLIEMNFFCIDCFQLSESFIKQY